MSTDVTSATVPKGAHWTGRVISGVIVLLLLFSAGMKLSKSKQVIEGFAKYGFADHLIVGIAITEIACAVLYAVPQTAVLGAILVTGYLGGATVTHLRAEEAFFGPIAIGALAWLGLLLRDRRLWSLLPLRR